MKKLIFTLLACSVISLGFAQLEVGAKKACTAKNGAKKVCTAAEKAACDAKKASLVKTAGLEADGYEVATCEKSGSVTAAKTCATSGKVTKVETCGTSGKTVKTVMDKEGNLVSKEVISGEAVSKNAATAGTNAFSMDQLVLDGYTMKSCATSGSQTAKKVCAASGKVTNFKETTEGVVTKTVTDKEGNVLSSETIETVAADQKGADDIFKFANLEKEGYEMGSCAKSGSKTAMKSCAASGKKTAFKQCGASGKVTKTVTAKDGKVISEEIMKNAATTSDNADEGFNFINLEKEGYEMGSCAKSGSKTAMKSCAASGKKTAFKQCSASGKVTKTVSSKEGTVLSTEIISNGKADVEVPVLNASAKKKGCCAGKSAKSCAGKSKKASSGN